MDKNDKIKIINLNRSEKQIRTEHLIQTIKQNILYNYINMK